MKNRLGEVVQKYKVGQEEMIIRYLQEDDVDRLCTFVNKLSTEDTYVMLSGEEVTREQEIEYIAHSIALMEKEQQIHLVVVLNDIIVGNAEVRPNEKRRKHVGTVTIAIDKDTRGKGVGKELLKQLILESKKSPLRMLTLSSMSINGAGRAVYERLGFIECGTIPNSFQYKDDYVDEVFYYLPL